MGRVAHQKGYPWEGMSWEGDSHGKGCPAKGYLWEGVPVRRDSHGTGCPGKGSPWEGRPQGTLEIRVAVHLLSLTIPCPKGGVTQPGSTETQRIPLPPYSRARHLVSMFRAAWGDNDHHNHHHHGVALPQVGDSHRR